MSAPGPQPAPVSPDLDCTVCVSSPHGEAGSGAMPGQALYEAIRDAFPEDDYVPWDGLDPDAQARYGQVAAQDARPAPELAAAMAGLATEMHARADAPIPPDAVDVADRIVRAQVLHEYAARIRLALGPEAS